GARLSRDGPMSSREALATGIKLSGALALAHGLGILHRDINPEHILYSAYGEPQLTDFSVTGVEAGTSSTASGVITNSVMHAAPEVLSGVPASEASDLWSLSSTIETTLTGRAPFEDPGDPSLRALITRILTVPAPDLRPAGVPDVVCTVIERGL